MIYFSQNFILYNTVTENYGKGANYEKIKQILVKTVRERYLSSRKQRTTMPCTLKTCTR